MQAKLVNLNHQEIETLDIPERVFAQPWNPDLVHQVLRAQELTGRVAWAHTKDRAEVSGGGKKPWRQKGTGRARAGSIRSPLWKGGGVTFGPRKNKILSVRINRKMRQKALFAVLSQKLREGEIFFVADNNLQITKTGELKKVLTAFFSSWPKQRRPARTLIVTAQKNRELERAANNLERVGVLASNSLNARDTLMPRWILIQRSSIPLIEKTYSRLRPK